MKIERNAFFAFVNQANANQTDAKDGNVLSVDDNAIKFGATGTANLKKLNEGNHEKLTIDPETGNPVSSNATGKKDPLLKLEIDSKAAAKNLFIRQQLLEMIRNSTAKTGKEDDLENFIQSAEKTLFGDYTGITGVCDLSVKTAKDLLDELKELSVEEDTNAWKSKLPENQMKAPEKNGFKEEEIKLGGKSKNDDNDNNIININNNNIINIDNIVDNNSIINPNIISDSDSFNINTNTITSSDDEIVIKEKPSENKSQRANADLASEWKVVDSPEYDRVANLLKRDCPNASLKQQVAVKNINAFGELSPALVRVLGLSKKDNPNELKVTKAEQYANTPLLAVTLSAGVGQKEYTVLVREDGTFVNSETFETDMSNLLGIEKENVKSLTFGPFEPMPESAFSKCKITGPGLNEPKEVVFSQDGSVCLKTVYDKAQTALLLLFGGEADLVFDLFRASDLELVIDFAKLIQECRTYDESLNVDTNGTGDLTPFGKYFHHPAFGMLLHHLASNPAKPGQKAVDLLPALWKENKLGGKPPRSAGEAGKAFYLAARKKLSDAMLSFASGKTAKTFLKNVFFPDSYGDHIEARKGPLYVSISKLFLGPWFMGLMYTLGVPLWKKLEAMKGDRALKYSDFTVPILKPRPGSFSPEGELKNSRLEGTFYCIGGETYEHSDCDTFLQKLSSENQGYTQDQICQVAAYLNNSGSVLVTSLGAIANLRGAITTVKPRDKKKTQDMRVVVRLPICRPVGLGKIDPKKPLHSKINPRYKDRDVATVDFTNEYVEHEFIIRPNGSMKEVDIRFGKDETKPAHTYKHLYPLDKDDKDSTEGRKDFKD